MILKSPKNSVESIPSMAKAHNLPLVRSLRNDEGQHDADSAPKNCEHDERNRWSAHFTAALFISRETDEKSGFIGERSDAKSYDWLLSSARARLFDVCVCQTLLYSCCDVAVWGAMGSFIKVKNLETNDILGI